MKHLEIIIANVFYKSELPRSKNHSELKDSERDTHKEKMKFTAIILLVVALAISEINANSRTCGTVLSYQVNNGYNRFYPLPYTVHQACMCYFPHMLSYDHHGCCCYRLQNF